MSGRYLFRLLLMVSAGVFLPCLPLQAQLFIPPEDSEPATPLTDATPPGTFSEQNPDLPPPPIVLQPDETPLSPEVTQFIKGMALLLLPDTYSDDNDWGHQKKVQSGLNVGLDGFRIDTSRRWKEVNHGLWQRVDAELADPEQHLQLAISVLPRTDDGDHRYRVRSRLRLRATVRQQRWTLGAKLYSVGADIVADVSMEADVRFTSELISQDGSGRLRVLPHVETTQARLDGFSLRNIGQLKGAPARELGNLCEPIVRSAVKRSNDKLPSKINAKIQKKPERFEIPAPILGLIGGR
ncbi:MAG: hypothetical protein R3C49_20265 [Planctomycetaceae bacterium]